MEAQVNSQQCTNVVEAVENIDKISITFISDTHEQHQFMDGDLSPGDIIVHSGDFTNGESSTECDFNSVRQFLDWFSKLPFKHKIFIGGNHDHALQFTDQFDELLLQYPNVNYLFNSSVTVSINNQQLKFYGSPFNTRGMFYLSEEDLHRQATLIQPCDVLITHNMPYDTEILQNKVDQIIPRIHAFGHMHGHWGVNIRDGVVYINSSSVSHHFYKNKPIRVYLGEKVEIVDFENITYWDPFPGK
ncbi:Metallophosphoesterase [Hexamita inflata]|uniref:Metallophosphoesterase n=1 Tax=Hexamita inflata TaxID=28002 RepID=A0AA86U3E4_9EUKA|nr:Metallophosphoesterase [Hexamita inflata]